MKEILDKLSSYHLFNYLLPGVLFAIISKYGINLDLIVENNFIGAFLYYFIGMVVSRIGSILIEPALKKVKFIKFADYKRFVLASKQDEKIELLSEVNNTYRTLISMLSLLVLLKIYKHYNLAYWHIPHKVSFPIILFLLLVLFLYSYRKQTSYITKRIDANLTP